MNLHDVRFGNRLFDLIAKAWQTNKQKDNLDFINKKLLCIKGHYQDVFDKGLISRMD